MLSSAPRGRPLVRRRVDMKALVLGLACAALIASPALACRGTAEYPAARAQIAKADLTPAEKDTMSRRLDEGWALHHRGHGELDAKLRRQSLEILDAIKARIGM